MTNGRAVRILLVGDDKAGKSTLIMSLVKDSYIPKVEHVLETIIVPPEVTPDSVTTEIIDSCNDKDKVDKMQDEIANAHVVCLVYSVEEEKALDKVSKYWLPLIQSINPEIPVVLVGNKIDLRGDDVTNESLEEDVQPIMDEFKQVETCVECSAKTLLNVSEVFYFAQKAVLYPTIPLYDSKEHVLKPSCLEALKRIFKLCDKDKDGLLNNEELNEFQKKCFLAPLQEDEIRGVKDVVRENVKDGVIGEGLTEAGFLFLHKLFIQRGRLETTWAVLKKFGYNDNLVLSSEFLNPNVVVDSDSFVELSNEGFSFLKELFYLFDKDKDGYLRPVEITELFATSPGIPCLTTYLDYKTTLNYLAYLGYEKPSSTGIKVITKNDSTLKRRTKSSHVCYVVGGRDTGKTSLLKHFIGKPFSENYSPTLNTRNGANYIKRDSQKEKDKEKDFGKYLTLIECTDEEILKSENFNGDAICYLYDSSNPQSFEYVANIRNKYQFDQIPCIFVSTKCDLESKHATFPDDYCKKHGFPLPISISVKENMMSDIYNQLINISMDPSKALPKKKQETKSNLSSVVSWSLILTTVAIVGFVGYSYYRKAKN